ncbi:MAG TPA: hypothetical protein VGC70_11590 [Burkholderiales bacterium]|jgi:hypothetical protein
MSAIVYTGKRGSSTTRDYTEKGSRVAAPSRIADNPSVTLGHIIQ